MSHSLISYLCSYLRPRLYRQHLHRHHCPMACKPVARPQHVQDEWCVGAAVLGARAICRLAFECFLQPIWMKPVATLNSSTFLLYSHWATSVKERHQRSSDSNSTLHPLPERSALRGAPGIWTSPGSGYGAPRRRTPRRRRSCWRICRLHGWRSAGKQQVFGFWK